jgi:enoyl-CoA hydratase/carnithine racemase
MDGLRVEYKDPGIAIVTLDRPERRNALTDELLLDGLPDTFEDLGSDQTIRSIVVTGAGGAFCAGADLDCAALDPQSAEASEQFMRRSYRTVMRIREAPKPVIAAMEGSVVGAGLGLAAACDFRYGSPTVRFMSAFLGIGLSPDWGTTYLVPRLVGPEHALDIFLSGRAIGAEEALSMGLMSRLCDDPLKEALELAAKIAASPARQVAVTKQQVYAALDDTMSRAVFDRELPTVAIALNGEEFKTRFGAWQRSIRGD